MAPIETKYYDLVGRLQIQCILFLDLRLVVGCAHGCRRYDVEEGLSEAGDEGPFIIDRLMVHAQLHFLLVSSR